MAGNPRARFSLRFFLAFWLVNCFVRHCFTSFRPPSSRLRIRRPFSRGTKSNPATRLCMARTRQQWSSGVSHLLPRILLLLACHRVFHVHAAGSPKVLVHAIRIRAVDLLDRTLPTDPVSCLLVRQFRRRLLWHRACIPLELWRDRMPQRVATGKSLRDSAGLGMRSRTIACPQLATAPRRTSLGDGQSPQGTE
jgi:hypothetical protein